MTRSSAERWLDGDDVPKDGPPGSVPYAASLLEMPRNYSQSRKLWQSSIAAHELGSCKPCVFFSRPRSCDDGSECDFCHHPHAQEDVGNRGTRKWRPCKGKRDRYIKLVARLEKEVRADPEHFSLERADLPSLVTSRPFMMKKVANVAKNLVRDARVDQGLSVPEEEEEDLVRDARVDQGLSVPEEEEAPVVREKGLSVREEEAPVVREKAAEEEAPVVREEEAPVVREKVRADPEDLSLERVDLPALVTSRPFLSVREEEAPGVREKAAES